ncbi:MAG TPA: nucleotidyl transferase AbiEii/AbiGii toxin family protein [Solirubrobacterales bacterium]|nr:nucleotidyl transferase AbiEii/AbiGii toxin family protein [Solirubrobacterales bacterium]
MVDQILPEKGANRRPEQTPTRKAHLEKLVAHYAQLTGVAPGRVRRWISVMVLLGALDRSRESDPLFLLKGGVAIELRVGGGARATKDVDLVFFGDPERLEEALDQDIAEVREACVDTFEARGLHAWPPTLEVPAGWAEPYAALAEEMNFPVADVDDAAAQVREFIDQIHAA